MKDPTGLHFETDFYQQNDWDGSDSLCDSCLTAWPCETFTKWTNSNTYKIGQLQEQVKTLTKRLDAEHQQVSELREQVRRNDITIRGALMPFISDVADGVTDGTVQFRVDTDCTDINTFEGPLRIAGLREWHCTYESSRRLVRDGETVEWKIAKT